MLVCPPQFRPSSHPVHSNYSASVDDTQQRSFQKLVCPPQLRPVPTSSNVNSTWKKQCDYLTLDQEQKIHIPEDNETRATTQQQQQQHSSLLDEDDNHFGPAFVLASMATQKPAMVEFKPSPPPDLFLRRPPFIPSLKPLPPQIPTSYSSSKSSYSPPVVKASEPRWICERCNTAIYSSYEEAILHDLSCPARILRSVTTQNQQQQDQQHFYLPDEEDNYFDLDLFLASL